ncbi:pentatricopeptide repeat-containing protein At5g67570, chloroplastic [Juglans microcarpa x Juglans regia]|uniref:pentatricopeptide repeat-containing protein At5g67570, chloroplastic n=1 Tax=Juglans microcarpa x Juglans regia TaxID=2249226 RepID=UPI001B7DC5CA|nr:pentatricopeptide repeat-containing protein At5g67570, chloroplastic [Juglans microcarpa x Juglans regia]
MEAVQGPPLLPAPIFEPDTQKIKRKLVQKGVLPTPRIIHILRKKQIQKNNRKLNPLSQKSQATPPLSDSQKQALAEDSHFQTLKNEYKDFTKAVKAETGVKTRTLMVGKPWESLERAGIREISSESREYCGEKLKREKLSELRELFEERKREALRWVLDEDVLVKEEWLDGEKGVWEPSKRRRSEAEEVKFLVDRLSAREITMRDWKFSRIMKQSELQFTESQLLNVLEGLGNKGQWKQALSVVEWVNNDKEHRRYKSRFVYTKLLAVLGKTRQPHAALRIFNLMRGDGRLYPDMAAYRSIAVTLGQAGLVKELISIMECMRLKPSKTVKAGRKNWEPTLEPDMVIYNAVLNACVSSRQWKGVSWVFEQLRMSGLKPNGATYGLAMEVMLQSEKYGLVHEYFRKMKKTGETPKALTYKVLVRAFWEEGKVNEAVDAVRHMEQRGVVGAASVYYELACCLCNSGRWQDAMVEVDKMKKLSRTRPLEVTFTGMIMSSMGGGHIADCISIFERMKAHCVPNIGTINTMLKVYGRSDMFSKAKELFEDVKRANSDSYASQNGDDTAPIPDEYTYSSMLEASSSAMQWEYFEYVYREMTLSGYQLDQTKHALLFVEASRAGKWYLLEHAFDTILEAGEVPHPLFFTEMFVQATAQCSYERAVTLVNTMAYAPFQVSERQWTDLFKNNGDRISEESLVKLLEALGNCEVAAEATVSNLLKCLHSLCGSGTSRAFLSSNALGNAASEKSSLYGCKGRFDGCIGADMPSSSRSMMDENLNPGKDTLVKDGDVTLDTQPVNHATTNGEVDADSEAISGTPNQACGTDRKTNLVSIGKGFNDDVTSGSDAPNKLATFFINEHTNDHNGLQLETLMDRVDSQSSNLPTADEVLESWKESRKKDGIFFPFQLGRK